MGWSYSGDPSTSDKDAVRYYVGDTNQQRPLLSDEEVQFSVDAFPNQRLAAAMSADAIAAKFTRESDQRVGDISKALSKVADAFRKLAARLRAEAGKRALARFPATSKDWKESRSQDTDLVQPEFPIGLGDNPWAVQLNDQLDEAEWRGW
jgi:ribosome maturation protein Sdo1